MKTCSEMFIIVWTRSRTAAQHSKTPRTDTLPNILFLRMNISTDKSSRIWHLVQWLRSLWSSKHCRNDQCSVNSFCGHKQDLLKCLYIDIPQKYTLRLTWNFTHFLQRPKYCRNVIKWLEKSHKRYFVQTPGKRQVLLRKNTIEHYYVWSKQ